MASDALTVVGNRDQHGWWEIARRPVPREVAGAVRSYSGYREIADGRVRRREPANGGVTLILSFGDELDIVEMSKSASPTAGTFGSFVVGLHEGFAITEHDGHQHGFEVHLNPLGAYRLLGMPMIEIANEVMALDAMPDRPTEELLSRLAEASSWAERFDLVDSTLSGWAVEGPEPNRAVAWAWAQLERSRGTVPISALADEIGWSRRHFARRFREHTGLTPKATARVLRFTHAVERLGTASTVAEVAARCGYADHSHLVHEFQALAGCAPTEFLRAARLNQGGVAA